MKHIYAKYDYEKEHKKKKQRGIEIYTRRKKDEKRDGKGTERGKWEGRGGGGRKTFNILIFITKL